jgi:anti-sigma factor RsiW
MNAVETAMQPTLSSAGPHLGEQIYALIDRELTAQEEASARDHLAGCSACAAEHLRLARTVGLVNGLGHARAPEGFAARVLKRARALRRANGLRVLADHKVPYEGVIVVLLAAAAATLLLVYGAPAAWKIAHNGAPPPAHTAP